MGLFSLLVRKGGVLNFFFWGGIRILLRLRLRARLYRGSLASRSSSGRIFLKDNLFLLMRVGRWILSYRDSCSNIGTAVAPWFSPGLWSSGGYLGVDQGVGHLIDWVSRDGR